jgi:hypothetical protein
MSSENIALTLIKLLGPEKASHLLMGEPIEGIDAWRLLDYIRSRYSYEDLYEDEENECYIVVVRFSNKYIYVLLKNKNTSKGYLLEILMPSDIEETIRLARREYEKCISGK